MGVQQAEHRQPKRKITGGMTQRFTVVPITVIKTMTKGKHLTALVSSSVTEGNQDGNLKAGTEAEVIETLLSGLFPTDYSLYFLKHPRTTCPGGAQPTECCALPHQSVEKNHLWTWLQGNLMGAFSQLSTLFLDDCSLWQVHIKPTRTLLL